MSSHLKKNFDQGATKGFVGMRGGIGRGEGVPTSMAKHAAAKTQNTESEVVEFGGRCVRYQV